MHVAKNTNDFKAVKELLEKAENGKEYYLATGRHAAIIRKK
ncbi:gp35 [Streptococcus pneumoniae]|nr:gp35 [Streptococcus pneumoniae]